MNLHLSLFLPLMLSNAISVESSKILGIFAVQSKSHQLINRPIVKGLAAKGHEVTVISQFKTTDATLPNYREILLPRPKELQDFVDGVAVEDTKNFLGIWSYLESSRSMEEHCCNEVFSMDYVKELIRSKDRKIELIIAEVYHKQCYHLLAHKLNVPLILVSPPSLLTGVDYLAGNPYNPSCTPVFVSEFATKMNFFQRLQNAFQYAVLYWHQNKMNEDMGKYAREVFNMELPSSEELNRRTALVFYNNHFSFIARPKSPNVVDIGGIHIKAPNKLPKDIEDFIESSTHGVILFSFGTTLRAGSMSSEKLKIITDAFSAIPQRVLWRVNELNLTEVSANVKLGKWFPQRDILEHEKVIAFISHCGIFGTLEAIHTATPVIAIPFMFDQVLDANILVEKGAAVYVDYFTMDKNTLTDAINRVVNDSGYRENMRELSRVFRDRPISALDEALYWSEYVLKHKGAPHLRTAGADMPLYQYLLLDVLVFAIGVVLGIIFLMKYLFKKIISMIFGKKEKNKIH